MERPYPAIEFECEILPGKKIVLPLQVGRAFHDGKRVTVRLTDGVVSSLLRGRGVTEALIEQISEMQLEPRENVIKFLEAECALVGAKTFRQRSARLIGRKR